MTGLFKGREYCYIFENCGRAELETKLKKGAEKHRDIVLRLNNGEAVISRKQYLKNSFNPQFRASLTENSADGTTTLRGVLGVPKQIKVLCFCMLLFVLIKYAVVVFGYLIDREAASYDVKFILMYGAAVLAFTVLFFLIGTVGQRKNKEYILRFIEDVHMNNSEGF